MFSYCMQAAEALARLCECADLHELWLAHQCHLYYQNEQENQENIVNKYWILIFLF